MTILQKWYRKTILWFLAFRNRCSSILRNTFVSDIMFVFYKFQKFTIIIKKSYTTFTPSSCRSLKKGLLCLHLLYCTVLGLCQIENIYHSKKFKWIYTKSPEDKNVYSKKYPHSYLLIEKHLRDVIKFLRLEYKIL